MQLGSMACAYYIFILFKLKSLSLCIIKIWRFKEKLQLFLKNFKVSKSGNHKYPYFNLLRNLINHLHQNGSCLHQTVSKYFSKTLEKCHFVGDLHTKGW